jgi:hypothetical protein
LRILAVSTTTAAGSSKMKMQSGTYGYMRASASPSTGITIKMNVNGSTVRSTAPTVPSHSVRSRR